MKTLFKTLLSIGGIGVGFWFLGIPKEVPIFDICLGMMLVVYGVRMLYEVTK